MTHEEIEATIGRIQECGEDGDKNAARAVIAFMDGEHHREFQDKLISLLRQADPETHIELPVDADGVPIHIGDELIPDRGNKKIVVTRLKYSRKHAWMIGGANRDDLSEYDLYAPDETRHYRKQTVVELLSEFGKICQDGYDIGDSIHEYADKIRELMGSDQ